MLRHSGRYLLADILAVEPKGPLSTTCMLDGGILVAADSTPQWVCYGSAEEETTACVLSVPRGWSVNGLGCALFG